MPVLTDIMHINADDTNVFDTRLGGKVPGWATRVRVQVVFSDYDLTFDCSIGGEELARDCAPHRTGADNLGQGDWNSPHLMMEIPRGRTDFEVLLSLDEVTAGEGLAIVQYEG